MTPQRLGLCVVDCGSGSSRFSQYSVDTFLREDKYVPSGVIPTLVPTLTAGTEAMQQWVDRLYEITGESTFPVIVGATGGLRNAIDSGVVTQDQVVELYAHMLLCDYVRYL